MSEPTPTLLADLRARRLARRVIEAQERLDAVELGLAAFADGERDALCSDRDRTITRLERAASRLPGSMLLRKCIDEACCAHRDCASAAPDSVRGRASADRFAAALIALREAMRRSSEAPGARDLREPRHDVCTDPGQRRS